MQKQKQIPKKIIHHKVKKENDYKIHVLWYCTNLTLLMPIIAFTQSK